MNLKFCLLTSFFNSEKYIDACIKSVINQTYKNWIWMVSDDGSSDKTKEILLKYCKENNNILYFSQSYKSEIVKDINKFVPIECDYFMMMDSDDKLLPNCLEVYNKVLLDHKDDNIVFASCEASWVFDNERKYPSLLYLNTFADLNNEKQLHKGCNVWGNLRAIKNLSNFKFIALDLPDQEKYYCYLEDYLFYVQMQKYGNLLTIKRNLYDFVRRDGSASSSSDINLKRKDLALELGENFINNNVLTGKSIKTWEKDLFDDSNSFLMSRFNFNPQSKIINFFTNSKNNFNDLYKLYYDKNLIINNVDCDFEYCVINACFYNLQEIKEIFKTIRIKKPLEVVIYINNDNKKIQKEDLTNAIHTDLSLSYYWSAHGSYTYYIINHNTIYSDV